jgi:hypothetical protein
VGGSTLVPIENSLEPRGLDLAAFETQNDAIEHQQLILDPVEPALDPIEPRARLVVVLVDLLVDPTQVSERVALGFGMASSP